MGFRIQNNISAMNAQRNLGVSDTALSKSLERLSSGYRINSAKDDAAGLAISQGFRADIASYKVASRNVTEANALLQVAEGAMDQVGNMLTRLKELATQASSANAGSNVLKINAEGNQLLLEIDRIARSTSYAGTKLVDGSFGVSMAGTSDLDAADGITAVKGMQGGATYTLAATDNAGDVDLSITATINGVTIEQTIEAIAIPDAGETKDVSFAALGITLTLNENFSATTDGDIDATAATAADFQVGAKDTNDDRIGITLTSMLAADLDVGLVADQMQSATDAQDFLTVIDNAISKLNEKRGDIGAAQNRLGYASANLGATVENLTAADSVIRDVDMAAEMTSFTKNQILLQAGTAMLAQANQAPQMVLSLFK
jgi:flagellin